VGGSKAAKKINQKNGKTPLQVSETKKTALHDQAKGRGRPAAGSALRANTNLIRGFNQKLQKEARGTSIWREKKNGRESLEFLVR